MKLLKRKVWGIPVLAAILVALALVGVVVAAILCSIPSSVNVVSKEIAVYDDLACTTPVTDIAWGDVYQGTIAGDTVYVKNEGSGVVTVTAEAVGLPAGIAFAAVPTPPLLPGDVAPMALTLTVDGSAAEGLSNFTINFVDVI